MKVSVGGTRGFVITPNEKRGSSKKESRWKSRVEACRPIVLPRSSPPLYNCTRVFPFRETTKTIRAVALFCKPGRRRNLEGKVENWQWFPPPLLVPSFNLHLYSILLASVIKSDKHSIAVAIQKWKKSICKGFVKSKDYHGIIMLISILFNFQH